ncbi:MAG TPA: tetratricopeptide repeat protein [Pyrinomonadaceae bacterium]|nr:tetratricopeptide repeat protein [Pyrinomonadaceae bacterium]
MDRVFLAFGLTVITLASIGCSGETAANEPPPPPVEVTEPRPISEITDADVALAEGNRLFDENQTEQAIEAYRHAISLNPDLADAYFQLGIAYDLLQLQNQQAGIVTQSPTNSNSKGDPPKTPSEKAFEKAVAAYERRIDANKDDHEAHFNLGRTYIKLLKDDEAAKAFKEAVEIKPDDTEYQTELGAILIRLAQYAAAIGPLKKAIELDSANARAAELLEDAKAGRQRIDYALANRNTNTNQAVPPKANRSNTNTASNTASNTVPPPPPPDATRPKKEPTPEKKPDKPADRPRRVTEKRP